MLISRVMAAGLDIGPATRSRCRTASGPRKLQILGEVEDFAWPSGTVYMDIDRYRSLYRTERVNVLAVTAAQLVDAAA